MGAGVVQVSIDKGYHVTMKDMSIEGLARGQEQVYAGLNKQAKRKKISTYVLIFTVINYEYLQSYMKKSIFSNVKFSEL